MPARPAREPHRPAESSRGVESPTAIVLGVGRGLLPPRASEFFHDWDTIANDAVAILRAAAGHDPYDKRLSDLIGELSTRSDEFRVPWVAHNVKFHRTGAKMLHHPVVGDLALDYEALDLPGATGQRILVYSAEPGSPSQQALDLLASWANTPMSAPADEPADER